MKKTFFLFFFFLIFGLSTFAQAECHLGSSPAEADCRVLNNQDGPLNSAGRYPAHSLRERIRSACVIAGTDSLSFDSIVAGRGMRTIHLSAGPLDIPADCQGTVEIVGPTDTDPIVIDGSDLPVGTNIHEGCAIVSHGNLHLFNVVIQNARNGVCLESSGNIVRNNTLVENRGAGILISGQNNQIQGNFIGVRSGALSTDAGNKGPGVLLDTGARNNTVGGLNPADANVIKFNGRDISFNEGAGGINLIGREIYQNYFFGNQIELNQGYGINILGDVESDFNTDNFPPNGTSHDYYPQHGIPVFALHASPDSTDSPTAWTLSSSSVRPNALLQFFRATPSPGIPYGQGALLVWGAVADTSGSFSTTLRSHDAITVATGDWITATQTTTADGTSEFVHNLRLSNHDTSNVLPGLTPIDFGTITINPGMFPRCGDGVCNGTETALSCPMDCPLILPPLPYCGDGVCNGSETPRTCPADCGPPTPVCGDGICEGSETPLTCPADCTPRVVTLDPPTALSASQVSHELRVNLSFKDNSTNEEGFVVERAEQPAGGTCLDLGDAAYAQRLVPDSAEERVLSGVYLTQSDVEALAYNHTYCYRVRAYLGVTLSVPSNVVAVTLTADVVVSCGDGICNGTETPDTCPADCGPPAPRCGDGICNGSETPRTCPSDCGLPTPVCGDGICEGSETVATCPADCGPVSPTLHAPANLSASQVGSELRVSLSFKDDSNNEEGFVVERAEEPAASTCSALGDSAYIETPFPSSPEQRTLAGVYLTVMDTESLVYGHPYCYRVRAYLGTLLSVSTNVVEVTLTAATTVSCGDGVCNGSETATTCPVDCAPPAPRCGDGICNGTETSASCAIDCPVIPICGDRICNGGETTLTCPADCPPPAPRCGDGICNGTETHDTCAADCLSPPASPPSSSVSGGSCGDGVCAATETPATCPADCPEISPPPVVPGGNTSDVNPSPPSTQEGTPQGGGCALNAGTSGRLDLSCWLMLLGLFCWGVLRGKLNGSAQTL
ncbi:MAG: hypothetical protein HQM15_06695 [Deltaproteobacteria bacterium]|nr:hypothetical protein [Deltaproteobacteria bacterium]